MCMSEKSSSKSSSELRHAGYSSSSSSSERGMSSMIAMEMEQGERTDAVVVRPVRTRTAPNWSCLAERRVIFPMLHGSSSHLSPDSTGNSDRSRNNSLTKSSQAPPPKVEKEEEKPEPIIKPILKNAAIIPAAPSSESEEKKDPSAEENRSRVTLLLRRSSSDNNLKSSSSSSSDNIPTSNPRLDLLLQNKTRHLSMRQILQPSKTIKFDPTVWVCEYQRSSAELELEEKGATWFTNDELQKFRIEAITRIQRRQCAMMYVPSGTGRVVPVRQHNGLKKKKAFFTDPALSLDDDHEEFAADDEANSTHSSLQTIQEIVTSSPPKSLPSSHDHHHHPPMIHQRHIHQMLQSEIKTILLVDRYDVFLGLFAKGLKSIMPHVQVSAAHSAEEALDIIHQARHGNHTATEGATEEHASAGRSAAPTHGFDMIVVEERLFCHIEQQTKSNSPRSSSATTLTKTKMSGSDLIQLLADETNKIKDATITTDTTTKVARSHSATSLSSTSVSSWSSLWGFGKKKNSISTSSSSSSSTTTGPRLPLLIGVSAYLKEDEKKLLKSGSDFVWGKPPPTMDYKLQNEILTTLLKMRGKDIKPFLVKRG